MTADTHRRWRSLDAKQLAIAEDLHVRVEALRADDPELTLAEAIGIAAIEGGHEAVTKPRFTNPEEAP
jgi:hypothetical protein